MRAWGSVGPDSQGNSLAGRGSPLGLREVAPAGLFNLSTHVIGTIGRISRARGGGRLPLAACLPAEPLNEYTEVGISTRNRSPSHLTEVLDNYESNPYLHAACLCWLCLPEAGRGEVFLLVQRWQGWKGLG